MSDLTLTLMKVVFLAVLWLFVIAAIGVIRTDTFGAKTPSIRGGGGMAPSPQPPSAPPADRRRRGEPTRVMITEGPRAGTTMDLGDAPITIGRDNQSTLALGDDYASGRHARLFSQNGQWFVEDLGSTNGTYLGRSKVTRPQPVTVGAPIRIGKTVIELRK
jgi:hypothetical protein